MTEAPAARPRRRRHLRRPRGSRGARLDGRGAPGRVPPDRAAWAADLDDLAGRAHQLAFFEVSGGHEHLAGLPARSAPSPPTTSGGSPASGCIPSGPPSGGSSHAGDGAAAQSPAGRALGRWPDPSTAAAAAAPVTSVLANGATVIVAPGPGPLVALKGRLRPATRRPPPPCSPSRPSCSPPAIPPPIRCPWSSRCIAIPPRPSTRTRSSSGPPSSPTTCRPCRRRWCGRVAAPAPPASRCGVARRGNEGPGPRGRARAGRRRAALFRGAEGARCGGRSAVGRRRRSRPIAPAGLRAFASVALGAAQITLSLAGAADPQAVRALVERWPARPAARGRTRVAPADLRGPAHWTESILAIPEKPQNDLAVAFPGAAGRPWDAAATRLLLYLLGETGYAGRLGKALVDPGLVYSVRASLEGGASARHVELRTARPPPTAERSWPASAASSTRRPRDGSPQRSSRKPGSTCAESGRDRGTGAWPPRRPSSRTPGRRRRMRTRSLSRS